MNDEIKCLKTKIATDCNQSDYISLSLSYNDQLEYERAARTLLCIQPIETLNPDCSSSLSHHQKLQIVIPCGGNASRWDNFLSRPKHLVDLGNNALLLSRTRNQISRHLSNAIVHLLLDEKTSNSYPDFPNTRVIFKDKYNDNNVGLEVLSHPKLNDDIDLLWIYGDTYFSENAFKIISTDLSENRSQIRYYGRKKQNKNYGNNGGELFAVFTPASNIKYLKQIYFFVKRLYTGTPMYRFSSWEVVSLLSFLLQQGNITDWHIIAEKIGARTLFTNLCNIWNNRAFADELWVEIDDETEDFDYPYEYLNWLYRRAKSEQAYTA